MSIAYVRDFDFEYGVCAQITPRVQRVIANNPGPFTYTGTGVYIVGDKNVVVIDPGPDLPEHRDALTLALEGRTVTHVCVTHHHLDHSPLAAPLAQAHGCKVYGMRVAASSQLEAQDIPLEAGDDTGFAPDVEISDGFIIKGKGWTLETLHTPGHTSNHLCFALLEENLLFSGDHIMGWSTSVVSPPDGHMGDYLKSLERVKARQFSCLWPTHGPCIQEVEPFIESYIAHRHAREAQILDCIKGGLTQIFDMLPLIYTGLDTRLYPAAAHSVLSHLIHMREQGKVQCVVDGVTSATTGGQNGRSGTDENMSNTGTDGLKSHYILAA